jgi:hypothetical protein
MADGLVALVTGAPLDIYFTLADTSGTSVGCASSDCRLISGVETSGVGPLVAGTTPGRTAGALAAIVAPCGVSGSRRTADPAARRRPASSPSGT